MDLLVTHIDLDGISPIILLHLTERKFAYHAIEINEVEKTFEELFKTDLTQYEHLYIVDLTLSESVYEKLATLPIPVFVFDHHATHLFATKYPFATIHVEMSGRLTCGTELFYLYLKKKYPQLKADSIAQYVDIVRQLDTYTFEDKQLALNVDMIRSMLGRDDFIKSIVKRLKKNEKEFTLTAFEKRMTKLQEKEKERYLERKEKNMKKYRIKEKPCGVVFAEKYKSELGDYLSHKYPELDFIIIFDASKSISYRAYKDDTDVAAFAELFEGGGHRLASGSPISDEFRENILKAYYDDVVLLENK